MGVQSEDDIPHAKEDKEIEASEGAVEEEVPTP